MAAQVAASSRNRDGSEDDEDGMNEDLEDTNDRFNSTKNSISPPASSFDSANSTIFPKSPSHNVSNSPIKARDIQSNNNSQINPQNQLGPTSIASNASLPLW